MLDDHVSMLEAVQPFVDAAISKTVNVGPHVSHEDFRQLYVRAWGARLKGLTSHRSNTLRGSVLTLDEGPDSAARRPCSIDTNLH